MLTVVGGCAFLLAVLCAAAAGAMLTSPFEDDVVRRYASVHGAAERVVEGRILGGIVPHHELALGMIARFYERIASDRIRRVWLLSPDHFQRARRYVAVCDGDWRTAGRILRADAAAKRGLPGLSVAEADAPLFAGEHGITIHIPFIARCFPNATIVPMVLHADTPDAALLLLKQYMAGEMGPDDLILLSMDLSHYKTPEGMAAEDRHTLAVLTDIAPLRTGRLDVDARRAATLVLHLFRELGAEKGVLLERMDSSDILGRRVESGTSYATVLYGTAKTGDGDADTPPGKK